ncbi:MAG: IclR family transcriptional regulator [Nocardioidaceae bacterium]
MANRADPGLLAQEHRTVSRVAEILEAAAADPDGVRLTSLAQDLGAPKSSIHGLLRGLVSVGYLNERKGRFTIGPAMHALRSGSEPPTLVERAYDTMVRLRNEFDETVQLGQRMGDSVVYISAVESRQLIKYSSQLNLRRPVYPTSMGKIFLAELDDAALDRYLRTHLSSPKRRTAVLAELRDVRKTRVAVNKNETLPGLFGAAAGVRANGQLVAGLAIVGPTERMASKTKRITKAVRDAADQVSAALE